MVVGRRNLVVDKKRANGIAIKVYVEIDDICITLFFYPSYNQQWTYFVNGYFAVWLAPSLLRAV